MVVVDNNVLTLMLHPDARPPLDPSTGAPVDRIDERVELLIETLEEDGETIIIPTPVLSEFLILADKDGPHYLTVLDKTRVFRIASFDERAAVELAAIHRDEKERHGGDKKGGAKETWAKIKFDRQILAIARTNGAHTIYSDDEGVEKLAKRLGIDIVKTWNLPIPQSKQDNLPFAETESANGTLEERNDTETGGEKEHAARADDQARGQAEPAPDGVRGRLGHDIERAPTAEAREEAGRRLREGGQEAEP
jgi:hypothetical protein